LDLCKLIFGTVIDLLPEEIDGEGAPEHLRAGNDLWPWSELRSARLGRHLVRPSPPCVRRSTISTSVVPVPREGRIIIYRSDVEGMRSLIAFLVNDCCNEHPELCNSVATPSISGGSRNAYF
jgi:hypothetical protein